MRVAVSADAGRWRQPATPAGSRSRRTPAETWSGWWRRSSASSARSTCSSTTRESQPGAARLGGLARRLVARLRGHVLGAYLTPAPSSRDDRARARPDRQHRQRCGLPPRCVEHRLLRQQGGALPLRRDARAPLEPHGIAVFTISPGLVRTAMTGGTPRRAPWTPPELAPRLVRDSRSGRLDPLSGRYIRGARRPGRPRGARRRDRRDDLNAAVRRR